MELLLRAKFVIAFLVALVVFASAYSVGETEQVVITQFGEPVGDPIRDAGLHFKVPFTQDVRRFEKRILEWEGDENKITTKEERFIIVATTARWRIVDALAFLRSVGDEMKAQSRLDDILDGATRSIVSSQNLIDAVRSSNRQLREAVNTDSPEGTPVEQVTVGREKLVEMILDSARPQVSTMGIELVDFQFRRIEYEDSTRKKVYARMTSERNRIAERSRSEGRGRQAEIEGQKEREMKQITSEAFRKAEILRGEADAEAAKIYADAYGADPEFYSFYQSLETLKKALGTGDTTLVLSTGSELLRHLGTP